MHILYFIFCVTFILNSNCITVDNPYPDQAFNLASTPTTRTLPSNTFSASIPNIKMNVSPLPSGRDWLRLAQFSPVVTASATICSGDYIHSILRAEGSMFLVVGTDNCGIRAVDIVTLAVTTIPDQEGSGQVHAWGINLDGGSSLFFSGGDYESDTTHMRFARITKHIYTDNSALPPTLSQQGYYQYGLTATDSPYTTAYDSTYSVLFAANCNGRLDVFDVSGPTPLLKTSTGSGCVTDVEVYNNQVFVASTSYGLRIYNRFDPTIHSIMTYRQTVPGTTSALDFKFNGDYVYIAANTNGLVISNIANTDNPTFVSQLNLNGGARANRIDIGMFNGRLTAFISSNYPTEVTGIQIVDIHIPSSPFWLGEYIHSSSCYGVFIDIPYERIYFGDSSGVLHYIHFSDIGYPKFTEIIPQSMPTSHELYVTVKATDLLTSGTVTDYFNYYLFGIYSSSGYTYTEDVPLTITNLWIGSVAPSVDVSLQLSDPNSGALSTSSSGTVTSNFVQSTGLWTASGPPSDVLNVLNPITFSPAPDYDSSISITFSYSEDGGLDDSVVISLTGTPVPESPEVLNPLGTVVYTIGRHFFYPIPHDTFFDADTVTFAYGVTSTRPSWIHFYESSFPPTKLTTLSLPFYSDDIVSLANLDDFVYLLHPDEFGSDAIWSVDLSDMYNPIYTMTGLFGEKMFIIGNIGYILRNTNDSCYLISADFSNKTFPEQLHYNFYEISQYGSFNDITVVEQNTVNRSNVFVAAGQSLLIFSYNEMGFILMSTQVFDKPIRKVVVRNNRAYLAAGSLGIITMNITDLYSPSILSTTLPAGSDFVPSIVTSNNILAALSHHDSICYVFLYNIVESNIGIDYAGNYSDNIAHLCNDTAVVDNILFVIMSNMTTILDIVNASNPKLLNEMETSHNGIIIYDNLLFCLNNTSLEIFKGVTIGPYITIEQPTSLYETPYIDINVTCSDDGTFVDPARIATSTLRVNLQGIRTGDSFSYTEDTPLLLNDVWVSSSDATDCEITIVLPPIVGNLSVSVITDASPSFNEITGTWHVISNITICNVLLSSLFFTPRDNYDKNFQMKFYFNDFYQYYQRNVEFIAMPVSDEPILVHPIPDQIFYLESGLFSYTIPQNTFFDIEGRVPYYNATYLDLPLPSYFTLEQNEAQDWIFEASDLTPGSIYDIKITAFFDPFNISNTFSFYVLNFTKVENSTINFGDHYIYDLLNHPLPMFSTYFGFGDNETVHMFDPSPNLSITSLNFTDDSVFEVSYSPTSDNEFIISITLLSEAFFEGYFNSTLLVLCDSPFSEVCQSIDLSINILGPIAAPDISLISFPTVSEYDILTRPLYDGTLCSSLALIPIHSVEYPPYPSFMINASFELVGDSDYFTIFSSMQEYNNIFTICISSFKPQESISAALSFFCNDELDSACGTVDILASIDSPYILVSPHVDFHFNEYDIFERDSHIFLGSASFMPNAYLPIIPSQYFDLTATASFPEIMENHFSIETIELDNETLFNIYLSSPIPVNISTAMSIHCNDPISTDCGSVPIEGSISSPSYTTSSHAIHLLDLSDIDVMNNFTRFDSFFITANNLLPIIYEDKELNCSLVGPDSSFFDFDYNILYNATGKFNQSGSPIGEFRFNITVFNLHNIRKVKTITADLSCVMESEILEEYSIISNSVSIWIFGPLPSLSLSEISFDRIFSTSIEQQILLLTNTGTLPLDFDAFLVEDLGNNERSSFSLTTEFCTGITLQPNGYCSFLIKFDPVRVGTFSNARISFITNSAFFPSIIVPIRATVSSPASLLTDFVTILPYFGAIILIVLLLIWLVHCIGKRRKVENQQPLIIVILAITIYDFITDVLFAASLGDESGFNRWFFYGSVGSIAISFLFNCVALLRFIIGQMKRNASFRRWFEENSAMLTMIVLLSTTNLAVMRILFSKLLGFNIFNCPLTARDQYHLNSLALITHFTEDIPQLIVQGYFAFNGDWSIILILSLSATILALIFGIFNRLLGCIYVSTDKSLESSDMNVSEKNVIKPYEAPLQLNVMENSKEAHNDGSVEINVEKGIPEERHAAIDKV